jgi:pSer/pThr/pTyr-binding forkhead associated (FHA) protein
VDFATRTTQMRGRIDANTPAGIAAAAATATATAAAAAAAVAPETTADVAAPILARVLVSTEGRTVRELPLRVGRVIVGRTTDNDLQIDSRFVSRHHCQLIVSAQACVIEDLNSTNGIYVKSKRVRRQHLNDGDVVVIGKHELIYVDERARVGRGHYADAHAESAPE